MKILVAYKSKYGATKQYAGWIAEELNAELMEYASVNAKTLSDYDVVIYGGGLYAGGISGVELVNKNPCKKLVIFTVGLADPNITDYSEILDKSLPKEVRSKVKVFHLRGGINYMKLGFIHKIMMGMMKKMILKKPVDSRTSDDNEFLNTYGKEIYFSDRNTIKPLVEYVTRL